MTLRPICRTVALAAVSLGSTQADSGMNPERLGWIRARMQEFVDAGRVAGVVTLIQRHGQVASFEAVGFQDLESKTPMRKDTIFQIMSMTKPVTATGVMVLLEEGELALSDSVEKHLPEFRGQRLIVSRSDDGAVTLAKPPRPITIFDLMTHTSGMAGDFPEGLADILTKFDRTLAEAVATYSQQPLQFPPGSRWQYSNMGIATLGRIIEVVSGQRFEEFIHSRICAPLGMKDSFFFLPQDRRSRLASLYTYTDGKLIKSENDTSRKGARYPMPEGGMYSTAEDMAAFYQMMLTKGTYNGKRILSSASVELMTRNHTGAFQAGFSPGIGFGLGWAVVREPAGMFRLNSIGTFGHGGAYRTYGWVDPEKDMLGVILMQRTNLGGDLAEEFNAVMQIAASAIER